MENTEKTQPDATAIHDGADGANPDFPNARNQMQKETGLEQNLTEAIIRYIDHVVNERMEKSYFETLVSNLLSNSDLKYHIEGIAEEQAETAIQNDDDLVRSHELDEAVTDEIDRYFRDNDFNITRS